MKSAFLSLIIPVYNAEKFIDACLNSVFKQLPDSVEVILVDDGSPDRSMDVVRARFSDWIPCGRLILLEQENSGPGSARNTGIRKSRGEYIAFLDSDDVLLDEYFDTVFKLLSERSVDIIEFGFKRFATLPQLSKEPYKPLYKFHGLHQLSSVRDQVFAIGCWFPSTRIYRRKIFEHFHFPEGTHYEDLMLISSIYKMDYLVYFVDEPLLGYRYNPESITSNHTLKQVHEIYGFYKSIPFERGSEAEKILKLKVGRSIVFFLAEIKNTGLRVDEIVGDINRIQFRPETKNKLSFPDWLFLSSPKIYVLLDELRVPARKLISKIKLC